jgi:hypothetical protein
MEKRKASSKGFRSTYRSSFAVSFALFVFLFVPATVRAQDDMPPDAAPPPLKQLSKTEKELLAAAHEVKERTKLSLELMDSRVKIAEQYLPQEQYEMVFRELGGFHALINDALEYLTSSDSDKKKVLNNFKRFEIGLRAFTLRLELIRREMPPQREYYIRMLLREMREARAKAVEPLFGDIGIEQTAQPPQLSYFCFIFSYSHPPLRRLPSVVTT